MKAKNIIVVEKTRLIKEEENASMKDESTMKRLENAVHLDQMMTEENKQIEGLAMKMEEPELHNEEVKQI